MRLGELNDELDKAGIPNDGVVLQTEGEPPVVFIRYPKTATEEQRRLGNEMLAKWAALPIEDRRLSKADHEVLKAEEDHKLTRTQLEELRNAVESDDKDALKRAVLKLLELAM